MGRKVTGAAVPPFGGEVGSHLQQRRLAEAYLRTMWHLIDPPSRLGTQLPPKGHSPQFSAHVYCGETAGWITLPFGTEVGFHLGDTC